MSERRLAYLASQDISVPNKPKHNQLQLEIRKTREILQTLPSHEYLHSTLGLLLLLNGNFDEAGDALRTALGIPTCSGNERANVLYNLACQNARVGDYVSCKQNLELYQEIRSLDKKHARSDPDFESVRYETWFRDMCSDE